MTEPSKLSSRLVDAARAAIDWLDDEDDADLEAELARDEASE